jgi:hypothetical protein
MATVLTADRCEKSKEITRHGLCPSPRSATVVRLVKVALDVFTRPTFERGAQRRWQVHFDESSIENSRIAPRTSKSHAKCRCHNAARALRQWDDSAGRIG